MAASPDVGADIDDLLQLPLIDFTAARNALAARLKAEGRAEEGAAVKALPKPPLSAWAVNQLYWRHRKAFDQLLSDGDRLRAAQASQLAGKKGEMRTPFEARRTALAELMRRAAALLRDAGHPPTPDLTRRIATTLEALATYGSGASAPPAGRLTGDVDPPGFEALVDLVPRKTGRAASPKSVTDPRRVLPFRHRAEPAQTTKLDAAGRKRQGEDARAAQHAAELAAQLKAAAAALRDAERTLREARTAAKQAESVLRTAATRAKVTETRKARLEKGFEKAAAEADGARQEARRVASAAEEAAQAVADAEEQLQQVQTLKLKLESNS